MSAGTRSSGSTVRKSHSASGESWTGEDIVRHKLDSEVLSSRKWMTPIECITHFRKRTRSLIRVWAFGK